jgi:hypothetical protein
MASLFSTKLVSAGYCDGARGAVSCPSQSLGVNPGVRGTQVLDSIV